MRSVGQPRVRGTPSLSIAAQESSVNAGTGNSIHGNAIFSNEGLGIDLGGDGVTFNHQGAINGPNNYQNYPVLFLATSMAYDVPGGDSGL